MKLLLDDGVVIHVFDPAAPELTDEFGLPALDLSTHPYFPQTYAPQKIGEHPVKRVLDAFVMRPSPGLSVAWVDMPGTKAWDVHFELLDIAVQIMLGKRLVNVTK